MNPPQPYRAASFGFPYSTAGFGGVTLPVPPDTLLPENNLVALNPAGQPVLASDTAGLTIAGVATSTVDTTVAQASPKVGCLRGIFRYPNSTISPVTAAELGKPVYVEDERTIAKSTTNSVVAGVAIGLEDAKIGAAFYVWLVVGPIGTLPGNPSLGSV